MHPLVRVATLALLVILHTLCASFLFACARLYWYATHPYLTYFADLLAPKEDRHFKLVGTALGCIGVLHVLRLVDLLAPRTLHRWCVRRCPTVISRIVTATRSHLERCVVRGYNCLLAIWHYGGRSAVVDSGITHDEHVTPRVSSVTNTTNGGHIAWTDSVESVGSKASKTNTLSRQRQDSSVGSTECDGTPSSTSRRCRRFDVVATIMELTQIGTQVYQAHRSSHLISRVWINRCYVAIVVLFCWTTPLLHHLLQRDSRAERAACLAVDALLNVAYSIVLPLVIFVPYVLDYDASVFSFSLPLLYGDETLSNLVLENQLLFAVSLLDCGSKLVPHISILISLQQIGKLINAMQTARTQPQPQPLCRRCSARPSRLRRALTLSRLREHQVAPTPATNTATIVPRPFDASIKRTKNISKRRDAWTAEQPVASTIAVAVTTDDRLYRGVRFIFACLGASILAIHVSAQFRSDFSDATVRGCKQTMHPWFTTKVACSVFEFNCFRRNVVSPPADALDFLDTRVLTSLVFSHCTALEMPASLQRFPNLLGVEVYNATLVSWTAAAGISATLHRKMVFALLCLVSLTALPEGLLGPLPPMLQDIELSLTNLTTLPSDLHERWHSLSVLYIERSLIEAFPLTLLELEVYDLSLIGNRIDRLPELPTRQTNYYVLALSHNPLRELPRELPAELTIDFLGLEGTLIDRQELQRADWMHTSVNERVWLAESPACVEQVEAADKLWPPSKDKIVCDDVDPRGAGRFPLYLTQPHRKP